MCFKILPHRQDDKNRRMLPIFQFLKDESTEKEGKKPNKKFPKCQSV
jgi:hypothetical protein